MSDPTSAESDRNQLLWGASQLFLLGLVSRFHRNYRRFSDIGSAISEPVDRQALLELTRVILYKQRVYLNLLEKDETNPDMKNQVSALLLRQQITDHLDDLHVRLLEHNPEQISPLIPELDRQRKYWKWDGDSGIMNELIGCCEDSHASFIYWRDELRNRL
ncbi:MAG TPA: hypothetical protein VKA08_05095 [Balneolales bacterium]|nr:hypothetical protein [Balneolales bacterium]